MASRCVRLISFLNHGLIATSLLACGGGGDGNPTEPRENLNVSGTWLTTSDITRNTCAISIPDPQVTSTTLTQTGTTLVAVDPQSGLTIQGTIDPRSGVFSFSGTFSVSGGSLVYFESGTFNSNDRYTSETATTISDGSSSCVIETDDSGRRQ